MDNHTVSQTSEIDDYTVVLSYYDSNSTMNNKQHYRSIKHKNNKLNDSDSFISNLETHGFYDMFSNECKVNTKLIKKSKKNVQLINNNFSTDSEFNKNVKKIKKNVSIENKINNLPIVICKNNSINELVSHGIKKNIIKMNLKLKKKDFPTKKFHKKSFNVENLKNYNNKNIIPDHEVLGLVREAIETNEKVKTNIINSQNRYIISKHTQLKNIDNVKETYEYKYGELYGLLSKADNGYRYTNNFIKLKDDNFICYKNTCKRTNLTIYSNDMTFSHPEKKNIIYEREFSLNLSNTTIYLNIEPKSFFSKYCCTVSNIDKIHLVKINDIILDNVVDNRNGYLIEYRIGIHKKTITIPQLEFILESNNKIYSFICSNRKNFTNWIISILLRQGRELYLFR